MDNPTVAIEALAPGLDLEALIETLKTAEFKIGAPLIDDSDDGGPYNDGFQAVSEEAGLTLIVQGAFNEANDLASGFGYALGVTGPNGEDDALIRLITDAPQGLFGVTAGVVDWDGIFGLQSVALIGDSGNETLSGGAKADVVYGMAGADVLRGRGGDDFIYGRNGRDDLRGHAGDDELRGGAGDDVADGGAGDDEIFGQGGRDDLRGRGGNDSLFGGGKRDDLKGDAGDDSLYGDVGADTLKGGKNADLIAGGAGNDRGFGGSGADRLLVSAGEDVLTGGGGKDTFVLQNDVAGVARVTDFNAAKDVIEAQNFIDGDEITLADVKVRKQVKKGDTKVKLGDSVLIIEDELLGKGEINFLVENDLLF